MTEDEYIALARRKYQDLQQLKSKPPSATTKNRSILCIGSSQIYRLTNHYGAAIKTEPYQPVPVGVVYVQVDGAMLLTDEGYKENKPARMFTATALKQNPVEDRGGDIDRSLNMAHPGGIVDFTAKFRRHVDTPLNRLIGRWFRNA